MNGSTEVTKEIFNRIDVYADKLGILGGDIYQVILAQQAVDVWISIACLILSIVMLLGIWFGVKFVNKQRIGVSGKDYDSETFWDVMLAISLGLLLCLGIVVIVCSFEVVIGCIGKLINPEYYAIQEMRELF